MYLGPNDIVIFTGSYGCRVNHYGGGTGKCQCCLPDGIMHDLLPPVCTLPSRPCPANTYSSNGYDNNGIGGGCSSCPSGKASSSGATACTTLVLCPANTYSSTGRDNNGNGGGCTSCPSCARTGS